MAYTLEFTELQREINEVKSDGRLERVTETIRSNDIMEQAKLPDADIVLVGASAAVVKQLPSSRSRILPMRVHFVLDVSGNPEDVRRRISRRERWEFSRNLRQRKWQWNLVEDPEWFDIFYDDFYRPTMRNRHGIRERTESKEVSYECLFRRGRLFGLSENGNMVGGALCHWDRRSRVLTLRLIGVLNGSSEFFAAGVMKAIYHFLIDWSARNGVQQLDFQGTEPFLSKGTYQWKRRFGTRVILPPNHFGDKRLWMQIRTDTPLVRDFLVANPFLSEAEDGRLEATYFYDSQRPPRTDYSAKSSGVSRQCHMDLDEFLQVSRCGSSVRG